ncbi:MAG: hypothetical protein J2P13_04835 [Acidobacteria bacterium]|nr:hypothetical protein [Acidobacteriota bacterium]
MPKEPTTEDAQIIMRLYDLRREAEMRKARSWFAGWWPANAQDIVRVIQGANPQENAWFRQVSGYWDMAATFVLRGVLNEELFVDSSTEMWFFLAKLHPFLEEVREKTSSPHLYQRIEKLATQSQQGRERLEIMLKRAEASRTAAAKA